MNIIRRNVLSLLHRSRLLYEPLTTKRNFCEDINKDQKDEQKKSKERAQKLENHLIVTGAFDNVNDKSKSTYLQMVEMYDERNKHRRGHVEFIYAALKNMEAFNVHKDLQVYKALINVMPKGKFIPQNIYQAEFQHYPKQQQCMIDLLDQMEDNGVIPDYEMEDMLINVFGRRGHPVRKFWRMMYWMPKFKNASPWPLPNPVPNDVLELAKLALERMCTVDVQSKVSVYQTFEVESSVDETWIVSGQSPGQQKLLASHKKDVSLHIEGPFLIWLREKSINYFTLRGDPPPTLGVEEEEDMDDVSHLSIPNFITGSGRQVPLKNKHPHPYAITHPQLGLSAVKKTVHEQDDGTIFAICCTGTSTKDSLLSWIRLLEKDGNSNLATIPVLFKFRSPIANQLVPFDHEKGNSNNNQTNADQINR